jgi:N-sulfoglucosamine sulfohydrolase
MIDRDCYRTDAFEPLSMRLAIVRTVVLIAGLLLAAELAAAQRPNLLIVTVDDMSADSVGAFGCKLAGTTPHMDQLAKDGLRFHHAHVQVGNCMPSRNVMWSGRYPHNNRIEGFYQIKNPGYPHLVDLMKGAGYFTAIRHKVAHSTPYSPYGWDLVLDTLQDGSGVHPKDPASYRASTQRGIDSAKAAGKPFCLLINVADPHKPFYGEGRGGESIPDPHVPSRIFTPAEVPVPGFLFDDPVVRKELAHYYSSVRRADDCVGEALGALKSSGLEDQTVVIFLSDHGMPLPFAKTQLYHHSTHTPLIIRWPGVTPGGAVDEEHMVSAVDFLPTLLDVAEITHPPGLDGRSFAPLLKGKPQSDREIVVKEYNENSGGSRDPMRAIQTKQFLYIFNPWSNGTRIMQTATSGTPTYARFRERADTDPVLAARHKVYQYRVLEELYDVEVDPDCLKNLIDEPAYASQRDKLRQALDDWMIKTKDPMHEVFRRKSDFAFREAYVQAQERQAEERRASSGKQKNKRGKRRASKAEGQE